MIPSMSRSDSIRIVLLADTHLGFDHPLRPRVARRRRGPDFLANYRRVLAHAARWGADLVVHGGDLLCQSRAPGWIVDLAYEGLLELAAGGIPVLVVPGNHERSALPVSLKLSHPDIHVFDRPRTFRLHVRETQVALAGFPFVRRVREGFASLLATTDCWREAADIRLLCLHQAIEGATVGPSDFTFSGGDDVIRRADLPREFHAVLCGHIHLRQRLRGPWRPCGRALPILYPGSTERTSFAERCEEKGFYRLVFTRDARGGWSLGGHDFVPLPARPMAEIYLEGTLDRRRLSEYIAERLRAFPLDSVVRIRCSPRLPNEIRERVTSRLLGQLLPPGMSLHFGRSGPPRRRDGVA